MVSTMPTKPIPNTNDRTSRAEENAHIDRLRQSKTSMWRGLTRAQMRRIYPFVDGLLEKHYNDATRCGSPVHDMT